MDESKRYREAVKQRFITFIEEAKGRKGNQLSCETISEFLSLSIRTIYRIRDDEDYLPSIQICPDLDRFVEETREIRDLAKTIVEAWPESAFAKIPPELQRFNQFAFNPKYLSILTSKKMSPEAKAEAMTVQVLRDWVALARKMGLKE